ncbi:DUF1987 domain-containing protein [Reichenbachiella versicolor]|uniref:DUF1987 domain-containing protein n=1 Tax=Reichenbachiella versicolor TaxID=1821036 RepID=UPI000D6E6570|nr:DUF1987 domain-containing protein [Reichenbachiella versicolor]
MDGYIIRSTGSTPMVEFNPEEGYLDITGVSTPDDPLSFYGHVFSQLHKFEKYKNEVITINFALKNMTGSTTYIYILVKKLISLANANRQIVFNWFYEKNNEKILDAGKEISQHYNHPFKFVGVYKIKQQLRQAS